MPEALKEKKKTGKKSSRPFSNLENGKKGPKIKSLRPFSHSQILSGLFVPLQCSLHHSENKTENNGKTASDEEFASFSKIKKGPEIYTSCVLFL